MDWKSQWVGHWFDQIESYPEAHEAWNSDEYHVNEGDYPVDD